uniref:Uncharacterized protein n=1 Tax=Nyssomyia neivai TaxID=330878 RepID=A0A1L8D751_9DIPT
MIETLSVLRYHVPAVVALTVSNYFVIVSKLECLHFTIDFLLFHLWLRVLWGHLGSSWDCNGGKGGRFSENFVFDVWPTILFLFFNSYFFALHVFLLQNSYLCHLCLYLRALDAALPLPSIFCVNWQCFLG